MNLTSLKNSFNIKYLASLIFVVIIIFFISLFFSKNNSNLSKIPQSVPIQNPALFSLKAINYNSINFDVHYILNSPKENYLGAGKIYVDIKNVNFYNNPLLKEQEKQSLNMVKNYLIQHGVNPNGKNIIYVYN